MKIKEFLLYDKGVRDKTEFMDLIILDNECEEYEILKAIEDLRENDLKANGFYSYTNEDVYTAIQERCGNFTLKWIGCLTSYNY